MILHDLPFILAMTLVDQVWGRSTFKRSFLLPIFPIYFVLSNPGLFISQFYFVLFAIMVIYIWRQSSRIKCFVLVCRDKLTNLFLVYPFITIIRIYLSKVAVIWLWNVITIDMVLSHFLYFTICLKKEKKQKFTTFMGIVISLMVSNHGSPTGVRIRWA